MLLVSIFVLFIPHAFSLSFSFTSFQDDGRISLEKSARLVETSIELVNGRNKESVGRATYHKPMHLWDKATGELTDFATNFAFVIDSMGQDTFGDGIAFFLAPADSKLPNILNVRGAAMGLIIGGQETILNSKDHPFVAVEFDIYPNIKSNQGWDPACLHVGVDVNSIQSDIMVEWKADDSIMAGKTNEAFISYNASTRMFNISFTDGFDFSHNLMWGHLHHVIDLTEYLPEWVTFGFSAATGASTSTHRSIHGVSTLRTFQMSHSPGRAKRK
ncbi:hypothetical protein QN277_009578 [Acacia crassicarpa]|uniref:Legume lectin domain-containing protein n=1 Tax=Acacia crassicarpa TaxID=499986 RepID=A0AAE1IPC3_9FABA|nr:hypothetical protein QN277_009578 [Acacia crassicarpa]